MTHSWVIIQPCVPEGKRRIRVHTLCLPVVNQLSDVYAGADVQAITYLLANMGESAVEPTNVHTCKFLNLCNTNQWFDSTLFSSY